MEIEFTPDVGEKWTMKLPEICRKNSTVDVFIVEELKNGWKVESENGWNGLDRIYGREWFIKQILN